MSTPPTQALAPRTTLLLIAGIVLATAAILAVIFSTEPQAERDGAVRRSAMLVEVEPVQAGSFRPEVVGLGTVKPAEDVELQAQVSGQVVERAAAFEPGAFVKQGELLLRLEPADYRHDLAQARSELAEAEAALALEQGRQAVARAERDRAATPLPQEQEALVLRQPQLRTAEAAVEAARAAVAQAELDLARTRIRAPFDAHVLSRSVSLGSQVSAGETLGRLVGLDRYHVEVSLPVSATGQLSLPEGPDQPGAVVRIRDRAAWPEDTWREGRVVSLIGALDDEARMARVLVSVPDPQARLPETEGPPLLAGAYVEARFEGAPLQDVVRLPRELLRKDDTAWVMQEEQLRIRPVRVVARDPQHVYLDQGLEGGELVVRTNLSTVAEGAPLRLEGDSP